MSFKNQIVAIAGLSADTPFHELISNIIQLIENAKTKVIIQTNSVMVTLYCNIGNTINKQILRDKRAEYGEQILEKMAEKLTQMYGSGFDRSNISRMLKFTKIFSEEICATLSHKLSWSHIVKLMSIEDKLKRGFYIEMCYLEKWSV